MFSSYLLTGGLGHLGTALTETIFTQSTAHIVVLDNLSGHNSTNTISPEIYNSSRFHLFRGDVKNEQLVDKILKEHQIDCIIDCASRASSAVKISPSFGARNSMQGITHVLDSVRRYCQLKSYLLVSSQEVYGDGSGEESCPLTPKSFLGAALMGTEAMAHSYVISYRIPLGIVRLTSGLVESTVELLKGGQQVSSDLNLLSTADACQAILRASEIVKNGEVWNVGGDFDYELEEVQKVVNGGDIKQLSPVVSRFNSTKAKTQLNLKPANDVEKLLVERCSSSAPACPNYTKCLVFDAQGSIGEHVCSLLKTNGIEYVAANSCPGKDADEAVMAEIVEIAPSHVVSMDGTTQGEGVDSIAYLEGGPDKLKVNIRDNLYAPWILASLCEKSGVHFTYLGTTEQDLGKHDGTSYSAVKGFTDRLLRHFPGTRQSALDERTSVEALFPTSSLIKNNTNDKS